MEWVVDLFPYVGCLAIFVTCAEIFTYKGFFSNHFYFSQFVFTAICLAHALIIIRYKFNSLSELHKTTYKLTFALSSLALPLSIISYIVLSSVEKDHYPNYIFTKYHLVIDLMPALIFTELIVLTTSYLILARQSHTKFYKNAIYGMLFKNLSDPVYKVLRLIIFLMSMWIFGKYVLNGILITYSVNKQAYSLITSSYDEKMRSYWGPIYDYFSFIKSNTPEDAVILIPPQMSPWQTEGNAGLVRYFLYPRKVINGELTDINYTNVEYILITWGSWGVNDKSLYGWPKITIPADKITYWNSENNGTTTSEEVQYVPKNDDNIWGIIKVRK